MNQTNNNLKILGILFLCEFALSALIYLLMFFMVGLSAILAIAGTKNSDNSAALASTGVMLLVVLIVFALIAPLGIAGWKLLKNKPNAKIWGVVASVLSIFFMCPFGLIVGILGFAFLFGKHGDDPHQYIHGSIHPPGDQNQNWR